MSTAIIMMLTSLALMLMDIITGLIKAVSKGEFSSAEMRIGLLRKSGTLFLILLAYGIQIVAGYIPELPSELSLVYDVTVVYVILMEVASNLENILEINPELGGDKLRGFFGIVKKEEEDDK